MKYLVLLILLAFGCASYKPDSLDKNKGKKVMDTIAMDTVTRKPRYNHNPKDYPQFECEKL